MTRTSVAIAVLSLFLLSVPRAPASEPARGDGILDLSLGWASPGEDYSSYDGSAALGLRYHVHVSPRVAMGAGIDSATFEHASTLRLGWNVHRFRDDVDVRSIGPLVRVVVNPASRVRACVGGGVAYHRWDMELRMDDWPGVQTVKHSVGAHVSGGAEMELTRHLVVGAEARYGYLDFKTAQERSTQATLALRLGYRF